MTTTSVLYVDPAANLGNGPSIMKDVVAALATNNVPLQERLRTKMNTVHGFSRHVEDYIGVAPLDITAEMFYGFLLDKDMACLKISYLVQVILATIGAPEMFHISCFNRTLLAINTIINVYVRAMRRTDIATVIGYTPPEILAIDQVASAFAEAFGPIMPGRIETAFDDMIEENTACAEDIDKDLAIILRVANDPHSDETYNAWVEHVREAGFESQFSGIGTLSTRKTDQSYRKLAILFENKENVDEMQLLCERRAGTFRDINKMLVQFRDMVIARMPSKRAALGASLVPPSPRNARPQSTPVSRMAPRPGSSGVAMGGMVQRNILVSFIGQ